MDSLTQIVLGAACGEVALGKKIGNKALLFGAIGGTIPDLDVYVGNWIYNNEIDAMLFHRGFMHSIVFATIMSLALGWLAFKLYDSGIRSNKTKLREWIWLWFLALFTHPVLDCFTPYGTMLFEPFSSYRVAFNNIAVVDPFYTLPFLICMIFLMFFRRDSNRRKVWLKWGLGLSSAYMLLTLINKFYIDSVFRNSMDESNITYTRYMTQPAIFNNILWYGIAETDDSYFVSDYSLFDTKNRFLSFKKIEKQRDFGPTINNDIKKLSWFSNGYYNIIALENEEYLYCDLRYPLMDDASGTNRSVFSFTLYKESDRLNLKPSREKFDGVETFLKKMYERIKGI